MSVDGRAEGDGVQRRALEEILRMVIDKELKMIIISGYILGALVGALSFGIQAAFLS